MKRIPPGPLLVGAGLAFLTVGGALMGPVQAEFSRPGVQIVDLRLWTELLSMHATATIYLGLWPIGVGLGLATVKPPRPSLAYVGTLLLIAGGVIALVGIHRDIGTAFGWTAYAPLERPPVPAFTMFNAGVVAAFSGLALAASQVRTGTSPLALSALLAGALGLLPLTSSALHLAGTDIASSRHAIWYAVLLPVVGAIGEVILDGRRSGMFLGAIAASALLIVGCWVEVAIRDANEGRWEQILPALPLALAALALVPGIARPPRSDRVFAALALVQLIAAAALGLVVSHTADYRISQMVPAHFHYAFAGAGLTAFAALAAHRSARFRTRGAQLAVALLLVGINVWLVSLAVAGANGMYRLAFDYTARFETLALVGTAGTIAVAAAVVAFVLTATHRSSH